MLEKQIKRVTSYVLHFKSINLLLSPRSACVILASMNAYKITQGEIWLNS